jgi:hypothetical protein
MQLKEPSMYEYAENRRKVLELARQCLSAAAGAMEPLYLYNFEDDAEAHDDSLRERVAAEFDEVWLGVVAELTKTLGLPTRLKLKRMPDGFLYAV